MKKYRQIASLYFRNPSFLVLAWIFFVSLVISRLSLRMKLYDWAEDTFELLFVVSIWLSFELGVLIKRQFANFRASLFPRYRVPHISVAGILAAILVILIVLWRKGIYVPFISRQEYVGISLFCLLMYLVIIFVAYLSISRFVFIGYSLVLVAAAQSDAIISFLGSSPVVSKTVLLIMLMLIGYFLKRLLALREDHFEYPFILSWPRGDLFGRSPASDGLNRWMILINEKFFACQPIKAYPRDKGALVRALHWEQLNRGDFLGIFFLLMLLTPIYLWYVKTFSGPEAFYLKPYSNFLIFSVAPVLAAVCMNYRRMAYWIFDLIKPVDKKEFIRERAITYGLYSGVSWLLFCLYFAVIPNIWLKTTIWQTSKFWLYLLLTGCYSFMTMAWMAYLAALTETRRVILSGIILCVVTQAEFMLMPYGTINVLWWNILLVIILAGFLTRLAFRRWCEVEG